MKQHNVLLMILWLLLTACSSSSAPSIKTQTIQIRYSAYLGKTIPLFILDNGAPYHSKKLANGNTLYAWNSGQYRIYTTIRREWEGDDFMKSECEIRLLANPKGRILRISALRNTSKDWDPQSCRDYLK